MRFLKRSINDPMGFLADDFQTVDGFGASVAITLERPGAFFMADEKSAAVSAGGCPKCGSEAIYKYGRAWTGKQRFLCLICGLQFTEHPQRKRILQRPSCPKCGAVMHLYMKEKKFLRFRCSSYPECKTFTKINIEDGGNLK